MERLTKGDQPKVIAGKIGVDPSQVSRWRTGKSEPSAENATRLARAYNGNRLEALAAAGHVPDPAGADDEPQTPPQLADARSLDQQLADMRIDVNARWNMVLRLARDVIDLDLPMNVRQHLWEVAYLVSDALTREVLKSSLAPHSQQILDQMYESRFTLRHHLLGDRNVLEIAPEQTASSEGDENEEDDLLDLAARNVKKHPKPE